MLYHITISRIQPLQSYRLTASAIHILPESAAVVIPSGSEPEGNEIVVNDPA
ncbi:hypothetical protein DYY67_0356 [Candidatus Nitrosotalea sp. TS]|nr:hypothetical protein [Candidatus Nitrosotalea sp. TS]